MDGPPDLEIGHVDHRGGFSNQLIPVAPIRSVAKEPGIALDESFRPDFDKRFPAAPHVPPAETADRRRPEDIDDQIPHRIGQP